MGSGISRRGKSNCFVHHLFGSFPVPVLLLLLFLCLLFTIVIGILLWFQILNSSYLNPQVFLLILLSIPLWGGGDSKGLSKRCLDFHLGFKHNNRVKAYYLTLSTSLFGFLRKCIKPRDTDDLYRVRSDPELLLAGSDCVLCCLHNIQQQSMPHYWGCKINAQVPEAAQSGYFSSPLHWGRPGWSF